eukprot:GGOE01018471.1.p1 GENE.GGOE01018471.1~~GGOE01018471.1.p1  ORF type:complete len:629 (+),score=137.61 GGOE01018471.1:60-1946(+)
MRPCALCVDETPQAFFTTWPSFCLLILFTVSVFTFPHTILWSTTPSLSKPLSPACSIPINGLGATSTVNTLPKLSRNLRSPKFQCAANPRQALHGGVRDIGTKVVFVRHFTSPWQQSNIHIAIALLSLCIIVPFLKPTLQETWALTMVMGTAGLNDFEDKQLSGMEEGWSSDANDSEEDEDCLSGEEDEDEDDGYWGIHEEYDEWLTLTGQTSSVNDDLWWDQNGPEIGGPPSSDSDEESDEDEDITDGVSEQNGDVAEEIPEGVLDELYMWIGELKYGDDAQQLDAARALHPLASSQARRKEIANIGAIPALVSLLLSGTVEGKAEAAATLAELAQYNPNVKLAVDAGAIPLLVALLRVDNDGCQMAALVALRAMTEDGVFQSEVAAAGAIEAAILSLQAQEKAVRQQGVAFFSTLLGEGAWGTEHALLCSVNPLLDMLTATASSHPLDAVVETLGLFTLRNERLKNAVANAASQIVPLLVSMLQGGAEEVQGEAAGLLACLADTHAMPLILEAGGMEALVAFSKTGSLKGRVMAIWSMIFFGLLPGNALRLVEAGALESLAEAVQADDELCQEAAITTLLQLSALEDILPAISASGVLPPLRSVALTPSSNSREAAQTILFRIGNQ